MIFTEENQALWCFLYLLYICLCWVTQTVETIVQKRTKTQFSAQNTHYTLYWVHTEMNHTQFVSVIHHKCQVVSKDSSQWPHSNKSTEKVVLCSDDGHYGDKTPSIVLDHTETYYRLYSWRTKCHLQIVSARFQWCQSFASEKVIYQKDNGQACRGGWRGWRCTGEERCFMSFMADSKSERSLLAC